MQSLLMTLKEYKNKFLVNQFNNLNKRLKKKSQKNWNKNKSC